MASTTTKTPKTTPRKAARPCPANGPEGTHLQHRWAVVDLSGVEVVQCQDCGAITKVVAV